MFKCIAVGCVLGWGFFAVFGYLAVTGMHATDAGALIAAVLALYGLAVGSMTWGHLNRAVRAIRYPVTGSDVIDS